MPIPQSSTLPTTNKAPLLKRLYYQTRYCALICSALLCFKIQIITYGISLILTSTLLR